VNKNNKFFRQYVYVQFNRNISNKSIFNNTFKGKQVNISRTFLSISLRPSKNLLAKSKFFEKNLITDSVKKSNNKLYAQALKGNIKDIFKIKDAFSKLSLDKVSEIHDIMNKLSQKGKLKFSMTTKNLYRKQIIISMKTNNVERVLA